MKTLIPILITAIFVITAISIDAHAREIHSLKDSTKTHTFSEAKVLLTRLDIINATDKTTFTKREKKRLRKEARVIKSELKELRGGRYIPVGAVVMVLIVPIIIF